MKRLSTLAFLFALAFACGAQPAPRYENFGTITEPPQIDATEFINHGEFDLFTALPFDTLNTLYFTNRGIMIGSVGYRFDYSTLSGRRPAASFHNRGEIFSQSIGSIGPIDLNLIFAAVLGGYLDISATNVVSTGVMGVGPLGVMTIKGSSVELARSGLTAGFNEIADLGVPFTSRIGDAEYINPGGVNEVYWGVGINARLDPQATGIPLALANVVMPSSGPHEVANTANFTNFVTIPNPNFAAMAGYTGYANTNMVSETNLVAQVVYVPTNFLTGATVDVRFAPPAVAAPAPGTSTAVVEFGLPDIDAVTGLPFTNRIYIIDTHAAVTNAFLMTNFYVTNFSRPDVLDIAFAPPPAWTGGQPGNAPYTPELIVNPANLSPNVTNFYAAVSLSIGTQTRVGPATGTSPLFPSLTRFLTPADNAIFGGGTAGYLTDPTNNPARIEIDADSLDIYLARLKSDGVMTLRARHFTGRSPVRTDAPFFRFDLGSTNGSVVVSNVIPPTVRRLTGVLSCWSGVWTNQIGVVGMDTNVPPQPVTNIVEIRTHALIVDPSQLGSEQLVETIDASFNSTHVEFHDLARITRSLRIDAESFHNLGEIDMFRPDTITAEQFPSLLVLTNDGSLNAPQGFNLGADRPGQVQLVVNSGTISSSGVQIWSRDLMNTGIIGATESVVEIDVENAKFDGGSIAARSDVIIRARDLKAQASLIQAGTAVTNPVTGVVTWYPGVMSLDVTDRLTDSDGGSENIWIAHEGFQLLSKPAEGDLHATTLRSEGNIYGEPIHLWAAEDRGPIAAGYSNNVAVGRLVLSGRFGTLFTFGGTGVSNAIYVNFLELTGETTTNSINIRPDFRIYFNDSNVPVEELDGLFEGRLVRVTDVTLPQPPSGIEGGGNGGTNSAVRLRLEGGSGNSAAPASLTWVDLPGGTYSVEYTTNLVTGPWLPLGEASNGPSRMVQMTLPPEMVQPDVGSIFFRVASRRESYDK
jgi:hypothetical protein